MYIPTRSAILDHRKWLISKMHDIDAIPSDIEILLNKLDEKMYLINW